MLDSFEFVKEKNKKDSINNNKKYVSSVSNKENLIESRDACESVGLIVGPDF